MTVQPQQVGGPPAAPIATAGAGVGVRAADVSSASGVVSRVAQFAALALATLAFVFPFIWLLSASLKTRQTVFSNELFQQPLQFENYTHIFEITPIANWLFNSVIVSVLAAATVTISSALVAFAFAYFRFPFR